MGRPGPPPGRVAAPGGPPPPRAGGLGSGRWVGVPARAPTALLEGGPGGLGGGGERAVGGAEVGANSVACGMASLILFVMSWMAANTPPPNSTTATAPISTYRLTLVLTFASSAADFRA